MSHRPIEVEVYDAWTRPFVNVGYQPGLDRLTYLQVSPNFSYGWYGHPAITDTRDTGEAAFKSGFGHGDLATWPPGMPARMPVDWSEINSGTAGGPVFALHHHDPVTALTAPLPHPYARQVAASLYSPTSDGDDCNVGATAYHEDISAANHAAGGPVHLRLNERNRDGGTWLERPLNLRWHDVAGGQAVIELADNDLFAAFDLRERGRYCVLDGNGVTVLAAEAADFLRFRPGELWRLYLRPQMWWLDITILCHYLIITPFAEIPADEILFYEGAMRPPVWPYRHNLLSSRTTADVPSYFGGMFSWDDGINSGFNASAVAVGLREAVRAQEYHTMCMAQILLSNELPWCNVWTDAPAAGDIIAAFDHVDRATGQHERYLLQQAVDLQAIYPDRIIGAYLLDFIVA